MSQYILAHDLGTSGNKATLYDLDGNLKGSFVGEYPIYYPADGWVEQDADDWWRVICDSTRGLIEHSGICASDIACVCFSAQMMGCLLVDREGTPLRNMILWADTRSSAQEKHMLERVGLEEGYRITGHRISASYSAAKLLWVRDNQPEIYKKAAKMLHAKEYIIHKLTGQIATEHSDASGTNLLDIKKRDWSDALIQEFGISKSLLPDLMLSTDVAGKVTAEAGKLCGIMEGTPVVMGGGDGSCACVGAGVVEQGKTYNVIGTSSWISTASSEPYYDDEMRTFNWVHLDKRLITPCGTMQAAGYSYQWFRNTLCGEAASEGQALHALLEEEVRSAPVGAGGLLFLPYLLGERSPWWNHEARGAFVGLNASTTRGDMARAVFEGVGLNLKIILDSLEKCGTIDEVIVIGGGARGRVWMQILADIWQKPLLVPRYLEEATSMGAAICGGVGIGAFKDFSVADRFNRIVERIEPSPDRKAAYQQLYPLFCTAFKQLVPVYNGLFAFAK